MVRGNFLNFVDDVHVFRLHGLSYGASWSSLNMNKSVTQIDAGDFACWSCFVTTMSMLRVSPLAPLIELKLPHVSPQSFFRICL